MRVVVTGVAGFIGSHLATELNDRGHQVVGIDSLTDYYDRHLKEANLDAIQPALHDLHLVDVRQAVEDGVIRDADAVMHLAAQPGVRASWGESFDSYLASNLAGTDAVLKASVDAGVERIVVASSSSIYGETAGGAETPEVMHPANPYGVTKVATEHLCRVYAEAKGLSIVGLRLFTVYGPRQRPDMAIHRIIAAGLAGERFEIFGSGEQRRHFTFVGDVARAFAAALDVPLEPWTVADIASPTQHTINQVIDEVQNALGTTIDVVRTGTMDGDPHDIRSVNLASHPQLAWKPEVSFSDGIGRHVAYLQSRRHTAAPRV